MIGATWESVQIPYEGTILPGYFYKLDDSGRPRPTLVFGGGFDSSLEELFYFGAAAATRHGYNCLTFDGPGQGAPIGEGKLYHRHDWEAVVTPAVDYALTRPDVDGDNLALMGMSLGGYFAARAAAFEYRFRAAILFDGMYSFYEVLQGMMPKGALEAGDAKTYAEIIREEMKTNAGLRWLIDQGVWSFGASSIADFINKTKLYTVDGIIDKIVRPCLVMEGEGDMFLGGQPQQVYDALKSPKLLIKFSSEDGAENHCRSGALAYKDEAVFNWLDETLKLHKGRK